MEWTTVTSDLHWDDEVDVVCTDAGVAGLAGAISAVDEGAEVLVACAPAPEAGAAPGGQPGWFTLDFGDAQTAAYLAELLDDLDPAGLPQFDEVLPIRTAAVVAAAPDRRIAPFVGAQLRDWTARCISSPSGYLYTRVTDWNCVAMESGDGEGVEVAEIGSLPAGPDDIVGAVLEWLETEANERGVRAYPVKRFERLVFDEGEVIGAVFATTDGPWAVHARHGVLFCRNGFPLGRATCPPGIGDTVLRVALVGKLASRFGRVELLMPGEA
ncbi:MAG: hypothetical protein K0U70_07260 [Actinomycetia bacterium]|nr:hypothetical protein [Actinomycetes bacterium]MCH9710060.1 hypothetical protein [Actinomycetes bacterium]MCH9767578.1 hypothetical protein [Actinomycetes bacterium]